MAEADVSVSTHSADQARPLARQKAWRRTLLMISLPLLLLAGAAIYYFANDQYVSTDNAYVHQDKVSVSAEVGGRIVEVAVSENQLVKAGDLLFRLDGEPYRIAVAQADASIASAQVHLTELDANFRATTVDIGAAQDAIRFAEAEYQRQSALMERGFTTKARLQAAQLALDEARSRLANARADAAKARASLATGSAMPGENPQIAAARVQREQAMLNLSRTVVRAPVSGKVSQVDRLQPGQMMIQGLPALSIVVSGKSWVEANFKETDLDRMQPGQPAEITLDAYPGLKLKGHVESIGAGTGSEFSVLPAQNANGNWVKVTQRVPVRIAIDGTASRPMIAGLSAHVRVDTSDR
jgi:membrane fusion protein (multidrug efflux system)